MFKNETKDVPRMMTVRQTAATGILPEHALRMMEAQGKLPSIKVGAKVLINYDSLCAQLNSL